MKHLLILVLIIASFSACKNPCKNKDCGNGLCEDGTCVCSAGWGLDANGKCTIQDLCYNKDCGEHGTCNAQNGNCDCALGWVLGTSGKCDVADLCYNKDCGHGTCSSPSGSCTCDAYYLKDANGICNAEARTSFVGTWRGNHVNIVSGNASGNYNIVITGPSFDVSKIKIDNLFGYGCSGANLQIYATINAQGTYASNASSLCTQYPVSNLSINFLDPDRIKIYGFVEDGGTGLGWNLEGIYVRQ